MTRSPDTQLSPFIATVSDAMTPLITAATEVAREMTETYVRGLNAIVEQQRLAWEASQQWFSGVVSAQSPVRGQLVESYDGGGAELFKATEEVTARGGEVAKRSRNAVARATRKAATQPRQRPSLARPKTAGGDGPAKWTSEAYEALTAAEIAEQLPQLSQREVREVHRYETTHQSRQTVLQKAHALRGQEPVAGYDELNVEAIRQQLTDGDTDLAARVLEYERPRKSRDGVLNAAEAQLSKA